MTGINKKRLESVIIALNDLEKGEHVKCFIDLNQSETYELKKYLSSYEVKMGESKEKKGSYWLKVFKK